MNRLWFDMTFTRTQGGAVGITRTVNRLYEEFTTLASAYGMVCSPIAFHSRGFRSLTSAKERSSAAAATPVPTATGVWRWISEGPIRDLVSGHFPLPLRRLAWLAYSWWDFNRLAKELVPVDFKPGDVLFLSDASWNYPVWKAAREARRCGARVVTVVYDLIPLRQPQFCPRLTTIAFREWITHLMSCSDGVLCISKAVQDDLRLYAVENRLSLPPTAHFRLGCDPAVAPSGAGQTRLLLRQFVARAPCFTAIGSIEPRKNYGLLLDAFERLWVRGIEASLLIIGRRTVQCAELLARIESHHERGRRFLVLFDGSDEEVAFAYGASRALVFPSQAEGFGLPLVEARARGCEVIASDLPAFAELADEGVRLFQTNSVDALQAAIVSQLLQERTAGRMAPFTWADSAESCLAFIQSLNRRRASVAPS